MQVGFLGPLGSFSHSAVQELFPNTNCSFQLFESLHKLQQAILNKEIHIAVMPFFNSKEGAIKNPTTGEEFIRFLQNSDLRIVAENFIELKFLLVAKSQIAFEDIQQVHVNPYAEKLCKKYLSQYPNWRIIEHSSSSAAAAYVLQTDGQHDAALASEQAVQQYGLTILDSHTLAPEDISIMHFLAVSAEPEEKIKEYFPEYNQAIHAYLLPIAESIQALLALLKQANLALLNTVPVGDDLLYIEVNNEISRAQEEFLIQKLSGKKLGCYFANPKRSGYQEQLLHRLSSRAKR